MSFSEGVAERQVKTTVNHRAVGKALIDLIKSRRSMREDFIADRIPTEIITDIIEAGLMAPSSKNAQPWKIHVVQNREHLASIADAVRVSKGVDTYTPINPTTGLPREWKPTVVESARILEEVGLAFFIENISPFSDGKGTLTGLVNEGRLRDAIDGYSFEMIGLGAMIENMWLAAHAHGLGGVFMGDVLVAEDYIKEDLELSGDLVGVLAVGYTSSMPYPKNMKDDRVEYHDK